MQHHTAPFRSMTFTKGKCQQESQQQQQEILRGAVARSPATPPASARTVAVTKKKEIKTNNSNVDMKKKKEHCSVTFSPSLITTKEDAHKLLRKGSNNKGQTDYSSTAAEVQAQDQHDDIDVPCLLSSDVSSSEQSASSSSLVSHSRENSMLSVLGGGSTDPQECCCFSSSIRSTVSMTTDLTPSRSALVQCSTNGNKTPKDMKRVSFDTVEIHYHEIELGDNPNCLGPPLQIGWEPFAIKQVHVENFEKWRSGRRRHGEEELALSPMQRHLLISKTGEYKSKEIYDRMDEMEKVRKQRQNSVVGYKWRKRLTNLVSW